MLQLKNSTPFAASSVVFPDPTGVETLFVIVKAGFEIGSRWTLLEEQVEPQAEDLYWGEPGNSSLRVPSDFHPGKPATDVIVNGAAMAPDQRNVSSVDVSLQLGSLDKHLRVFGDRQWQGGTISAPQPFAQLPLVYERAAGGGCETEDGIVDVDMRNPVGIGRCHIRRAEQQPLPNIENPAEPVSSPEQITAPQGLGPLAPHWQPRASFAGTYDHKWQQIRAPYLPLDYNSRYCQAAHPDLVYPGYLAGGEPLAIVGMHPQGTIQTQLPVVPLVCDISHGSSSQRLSFNMETLIIEPNDLRLYCVWKLAYNSRLPLNRLTSTTVQLLREY